MDYIIEDMFIETEKGKDNTEVLKKYVEKMKTIKKEEGEKIDD